MKVKVKVYELTDHPDEEIKTYEIEEEILPERENRHSWICQNCSLGDRASYPECRDWCEMEGYEAVDKREEFHRKRKENR